MANKMKAKDFEKAVKAILIDLNTDEEGNVAKKVTNTDTQNAIKAVSQAISDSLVGGEGVGITGLGSFELRERAERSGRNPQTGEEITIEARKAVGFKPSEGLRQAVKGL